MTRRATRIITGMAALMLLPFGWWYITGISTTSIVQLVFAAVVSLAMLVCLALGFDAMLNAFFGGDE